jgi:quercetin dioxygenase-like cupin family protein
MSANEIARSINIAQAAHFSPDARINEEIMATQGLVVRMNCYEPGQVTPMHMHPEEDEILYIVEGRGTVSFESGTDLAVKAGDLVCLPSDQFHQIVAGPDGRMVLIYFMKPDYKSIRPAARVDHPAIARLHGERGSR